MGIPGRLSDATPPHGIGAKEVSFLLDRVCDIQRVNPTSTNRNNRSDIATKLPCGEPQVQLERPQYSTTRERGAEFGATAQVVRIITAVPENRPQQGDKLILEGAEYTIREADGWPMVSNPIFYHSRMERRP